VWIQSILGERRGRHLVNVAHRPYPPGAAIPDVRSLYYKAAGDLALDTNGPLGLARRPRRMRIDESKHIETGDLTRQRALAWIEVRPRRPRQSAGSVYIDESIDAGRIVVLHRRGIGVDIGSV